VSWSLHHAWVEGVALTGGRLATCSQCHVLRHTQPDGIVLFVRRARPGMREDERVSEKDPPCVAAPAPKTSRARVAAVLEREIAAAAKRADRMFPDDEDPATLIA